MTFTRTFTQSIKALNTTSRCFVPKSTIKSTTFPTITKSNYSTVSRPVANYSIANAGNKDKRPTVVISSDNDEVETVSDHIRV